MRSSIRWPRSDFALCSPRAQRTASPTFDFPQPFGPTIAVTPGSTFTTVFSAKDLKPWIAIDSRRMPDLGTQPSDRPRKKYQRLGFSPPASPICRGREAAGRVREGLLLEEVAEPATRVVGMHRTAGCVALDGDHDREQRTVVAGALVTNALGDVLRAFETARGIKVRTLAAGVQLRLPLRATRKRIGGD